MPITHCYFYPLWEPSVHQKRQLSQHAWWQSVSRSSFSLSHSICLSACHSAVARLSIKPVSLPVPRPSFWSPCPSTANLICSSVFFRPFSRCVRLSWDLLESIPYITGLTSSDWTCSAWHVPGYLDLMPAMGRDGIGQEENFILSLPLPLILSLSLFFNLALRVKTSIPNQGDVTSSRAWGDSTK